MSDADAFQRVNAAALRLLSYRPRSEAELRARLIRRFSSAVVDDVIGSLRGRSLLDDARFAQQWTDSRDAHRPRSATAVRRELVSKGIDRSLADEAVSDLDDEDSAYRAALPRARRLEEADLATFRRRLTGYLLRRGFTQSVARRTIIRLESEMGR